jgi:hypothetical protein
MIDLAYHSEPPVHLVLGCEAIGLLKHADANRTAEMEKWMATGLSTDRDDAEDFFASERQKTFLKEK